MAWNPSPQVAIARDFATKFGKEQVVILSIGDGLLEYASFGKDKSLCDEAKMWGDVAFNAIMNYFEQQD